MMLQGAEELKARLKAIRKNVIVPAGKEWATEAANAVRRRVGGMSMPYSGWGERRKKPQGRLLPSIAVRKSRSQKTFVVEGSYHAYFVDHGVKRHSLQTRKSRPKSRIGRTIFARLARKPHPGYTARPFRAHAAQEAYLKRPVLDAFIKAWNEAA